MHQTTFPHFLAVFSFSSLFFRICFLFINFKTQPPIVKTQLERYLNPSVCWFYWNFLQFTHACKCYIRYGVSDNIFFTFTEYIHSKRDISRNPMVPTTPSVARPFAWTSASLCRSGLRHRYILLWTFYQLHFLTCPFYLIDARCNNTQHERSGWSFKKLCK